MGEKIRIGVVADDITGANDIGVMLAKNGYRAVVVSLSDDPQPEDFLEADALIINTGSRLSSAQDAAAKSGRAARILLNLNCERLYTKTCSVFRGNIGASFDAVQDAAGVQSSMVVLGFPRNGRTTLHGLHYLNGQLLEESPFRYDPVNPMTESRLGMIIARQSGRAWAEFPYESLDEDEKTQKEKLEQLKKAAAYVIFDVRDQKDLNTISHLIRDERNICGASALCEELPKAWDCASAPVTISSAGYGPDGVLIVCGSLTPQTLAQTDYLLNKGISCVTLPGEDTLQRESMERAVRCATEKICEYQLQGRVVVLRASQDRENVRAAAAGMGLSPQAAGMRISEALGRVTHNVRAKTGISRILVAGGETSDAVSSALGIRRMRIGQEMEPGVPLMTGETAQGEKLLLVFKSGSFGSTEFLYNTAAQMRD